MHAEVLMRANSTLAQAKKDFKRAKISARDAKEALDNVLRDELKDSEPSDDSDDDSDDVSDL